MYPHPCHLTYLAMILCMFPWPTADAQDESAVVTKEFVFDTRRVNGAWIDPVQVADGVQYRWKRKKIRHVVIDPTGLRAHADG